MLKDTELMHMNFGRLQSPLLDLSWKPKVDKNQRETPPQTCCLLSMQRCHVPNFTLNQTQKN